MRTTFTPLLKVNAKLIAFVALMATWSSLFAQAPFQGGRTYWVDGSGIDLVMPKDTFRNLMGVHVLDQPYTASTGLISALNNQGGDPTTLGTINVILTSGYSGQDSSTIQIGRNVTGGYPFMSSTRPIVIRPQAGVNLTLTLASSVSFPAGASVVRFLGAQFVTIDGAGSPGQRNLTITMPVTGTNSTQRLIDIISTTDAGCQFVGVRNCNLLGSSTTTGVNTFAAIYSGGNSATPPAAPVRRNQNITIENNIIEAFRNPIYMRGLEVTPNSQDLNLIVRNNIIGGTVAPSGSLNTTFIGGVADAGGITLISQTNATIEGNTIRNNVAGFGGFRAIALITSSGNQASLDSNIVINANQIYNLQSTVASTGVYGIRMNLGTHTSSRAIVVTNNTIAKLWATQGSTTLSTGLYTAAVFIENSTPNLGLNFTNNSIHLYGDTLGNGTFSGCFVTGTNVTGGIIVRNNIMVNRMGKAFLATTNSPQAYIYIVNATAANPFIPVISGNNAYFTSSTSGSFNHYGFIQGRNYESFASWKTVVVDTFSIVRIPPFIGVNDTTLSISNGAPSILGAAGRGFGLTTDILGNSRSNTTPSMGAYEFTGNSANANYGLLGGNTYPINGTSSWPVGLTGTGSFSTLADAVTYLNTYGVRANNNAPINIVFGAGYTGETAMVPAIIEYPGAAFNARVIIRPAAGANYSVAVPSSVSAVTNQYAVLSMIGAKYITINGQGTANERNLTFSIPSTITNTNAKVVTIAPGVDSRTLSINVSNVNIVGGSTTTAINTAAGIYHGSYYPASGAFGSAQVGRNDTMTFTNNNIIAVRTGIYIRGANIGAAQNRQLTINRNIIGGFIKRGGAGNLTVLGGAANQAGILLKAVAASLIDSNLIGNIDSVGTVSNGFRGIDLDNLTETVAPDSAITIVRNTIYNLNTAAGQFCTGIRMSMSNSSNLLIRIYNNNIANIRGVGTSGAPSMSNPAGIAIDASAVVTNLGLDISHNTINLSGNVLAAANSSYCVFLNTNVQGGVRLMNNILSNRLGRSTSGAGLSYALFTGAVTGSNPFTTATGGLINGNAYGSQAINTTSTILGNGSGNFPFITNWRTAINADFTSFSFNTQFLFDSAATLDPVFSTVLSQGSQTLSTVTTDIVGAARTGAFTSTGSLVFTTSFTPLVGGQTYLINGANNFPGGGNTPPFSFATINRAIQYLNANGVDGFSLPAQQVRLVLSTGYNGEGDTLIQPVLSYPRMNSTRTIVLTTSAGRNDTIRTTGIAQPYLPNSSVIRFNGGSFFIIDGSNNGTDSRNITIMLPSAATAQTIKLVDFIPGENPVTNVTIRNCNLVGNTSGTTINTFAGVYSGGISATPSVPALRGNNNNVIENNFIGGIRFGVYLQGVTATAGSQDFNNIIRRNTIGGSILAPNTDYFGGVTNAAGIFLNSQAGTLVDSNIIRNNINTFGGARGIDMAFTTGALSVDSAITVSRNRINNITNSSSGAAYGIALNYGTDSVINTNIVNNMISGISSIGTPSANISLLNPFGIFIDGTVATSQLGLNIFYNSINLGDATSTALGTTANAASASIAFSQLVRGGISLRNNSLQNRLGRVSGAGWAASLLVGHSANIFTASDNNNYFNNASGATNVVALYAATSITPTRFNTVSDYMVLTRQDTMSISFLSPYINDTNLMVANAPNVFHGWARPISTVVGDINGATRNGTFPTIGADEVDFTVLFVDSIAPRVYNLNNTLPLPNSCTNGPFTISYRVFERNVDLSSPGFERLYFRINNGPEDSITFATTGGLPVFSRNFVLPAQAANTSIAYRYVATDRGGRTVSVPATGYDYIGTTNSQYPLTLGFDLPNSNGWTVRNLDASDQPASHSGWNIDTYGSGLTPVITPQTGIKAALFQSNQIPIGQKSRLISPCLDFTNTKVPTVRIWVSQNGEALTNNDRVNVIVSGGFNIWSAPLGTVSRPVNGLPFPRFTQLDVCLSSFVGVNGLRVAIEAVSAGGNNIVLDSVVILDDGLPQTISPKVNTICQYDSMQVTLSAGLPNYTYRLVDANTFEALGVNYPGNGNPLVVKAPNRNVDTVTAYVYYTNTLSGCFSTLQDTVTIYTRRFFNGPFVTPGTPFTAIFNNGTSVPDGARVGDALRYNFVPPSGLTNASYGTQWTIVNTSVRSASGINISSAVFTPPSGPTNANYFINTSAADADTTFILRATIRLLPTGCDSVIVRRIKVTSAPVAGFTNGSDSVCRSAPLVFSNTTTFQLGTEPLSYDWDFGDGTTSTALNPVKVYNGAPGVYTVKLRATNNAGVFNEITKQIRVLPTPSTGFTNGLACGADSIQFTNTTPETGLNYLWTVRFNSSVVTTSTQTNPKFAFALSDTLYNITLRATNSLGCRRDSTTSVFTFARPVANFTTTNNCQGLNVQLNNTSTITPGSSGRVNTFGSEWSFGNGDVALSNQPVYKYPNFGTYTIRLKVTSNYGCVDSASRTVNIFEKPTASFTAGAACKDDKVTLANTSTYGPGLNKVLFNWNFGDNTPTSSDVTPDKSYLVLGNYTIRLIARDTVNNCADTTTRFVSVGDKPIAIIAATPQNGCEGSPIQLTNGSIPPTGETSLTHAWNFGNSATSTLAEPQVSYTNSGKYTIRLVTTTIRGCSDTAEVPVDIAPAPVATIDALTTLNNCSTLFFKAGNIVPTAIYFWDFGDGTKVTNNGTQVSNTYQKKGLYTVTLRMEVNGCSGTVELTDSPKTYTSCTVGLNELLADKYRLSLYPNPFESFANVAYSLDKSEDVTIAVFDVLGRKVTEVKETKQVAGNYTVKLDEGRFGSTSGMYMVRIQIGDDVITKQLLHK